ncbi:prepilin-type N-terminal cleavage/methylation domain-containing protein [Puniceicoccales bacterium CK1056]|uniref:Prepilin-type N-terminal cleavage/methylation domain-containing protein n=1 Tax=Oceanipulchritudo coccoides TaxID=2706888 RepID=A0A6B2M2A6_9BACT|nr:prepilin-type N-terminal cleavage/methylation domain-containing protein [Oceanipulchritudo coccoides]NDV62506.1 prepilin-type N-terminal cleavage/methylation domain-containing protein [Oceanipulchritudo coccoides]
MTHAIHKESSHSGFSLIEAVIAIAIAGIAFFMLTETFFNVLLTLEKLESESDYQKDVRFVRSQIIQIADPDEVEDGGEISTLNLGEAEWSAEIEPTETVDLFQLLLEIEFENPDGEPIPYSERLYLLRPTWGDSFERSALLDDIRRNIEDEAFGRDW